MNWLERASDWIKSLFGWGVKTVEPDGNSQPLSPNYWSSAAGREWLNTRAKHAAKVAGVEAIVCTLGTNAQQYGGGPFGATDKVWMFGDTNAAKVIEQCMLAYEYGYREGWVDNYLGSIMKRAAASAVVEE